MSSKSSEIHAVSEREYRKVIIDSLFHLEVYVRERGFAGSDPYDALNSPIINAFPGKLLKVAITQFFVYSPIDLRRMYKVEEGRNPKAIALFLSSYCRLRKAELISEEFFRSISKELVSYLLDSRIQGYNGDCWGFNFPWQDITRYSKVGLPTVVVSSFVGNSLLDLYDLTGDQVCLKTALGICEFILKDLNVFENDRGICFSYTPIDHHTVHNANIMGAALLSRVASITGNGQYLELAKRAVDFTLSYQEKDGSWFYSFNQDTGGKRKQIDFHQGFILDSLANFIQFSKQKDQKYVDSLKKGAQFYKENQFYPDGQSMWRLPWRWPVDIHHQAQGIVTFAKLFSYDPAYLDWSKKIALWTIKCMQDRSGFFHYQKVGLINNKIPYMRWGQAWMLYALSELLCTYSMA